MIDHASRLGEARQQIQMVAEQIDDQEFVGDLENADTILKAVNEEIDLEPNYEQTIQDVRALLEEENTKDKPVVIIEC